MDTTHYIVVEYSRIECEVEVEIIGVAHTYEEAVKIFNDYKTELSFDEISERNGYIIDECEDTYSFSGYARR